MYSRTSLFFLALAWGCTTEAVRCCTYIRHQFSAPGTFDENCRDGTFAPEDVSSIQQDCKHCYTMFNFIHSCSSDVASVGRFCSRKESAKTQPECCIIEGVTYCKCYTDLCNRAERKDVTTTVLPDTTSTSTSQQGQESSTATPETTTTPIQGDVAPTTQEASQSSSFATLHPGILVAVGLLTLLVSHF